MKEKEEKMSEEIRIAFRDGTLLVEAPRETELPLINWCVYDARYNVWRGNGCDYYAVVAYLYKNKIPYRDDAREYRTVELAFQDVRTPRSYQQEALNAWIAAQRRGVIVLPTGTGKTFVAMMCMQFTKRSTLVVVPTIDLMVQWAGQIEKAFGVKVGMYGGGSKDLQDITVSTYDSAQMIMEFVGGKFGLLVVDECHHLPGPTYRQIAMGCIAPFRLGLSATPERTDGEDSALDELLGGICYRKDIDEMSSDVLATYETRRIFVDLADDEYERYTAARQAYVGFIRQHRLDVSSPEGWGKFVRSCAIMPSGREALRAYFEQKRIALANREKIEIVWKLLVEHRHSRTIVFTADNKTAYDIGERFYLPVLTHHTKSQERKEFLDGFRSGEYPCIVTSKVLNEGVDVPEADVGIVVSGSGSIREHVQRLGRILRPGPGKQAILYELVSVGTSEWGVSDRRRQHRAYERSDSMP